MKKFFTMCGIVALIGQIGVLFEKLFDKIKKVFTKKEKKTESK